MPSYRDLYLRWERLNWRVSDLDFTQDRRDWLALDDHHKERLLWTLAAFYVETIRDIFGDPVVGAKVLFSAQADAEPNVIGATGPIFDFDGSTCSSRAETSSTRPRASRRWT